MSDFNKGYVSANLETVSLTYKAEYVPTRGRKAGLPQGPMLFINKGTKTKQNFASAKEALVAAQGSVAKGTKVYVNGTKMDVSAAAKLDLDGYQYWDTAKSDKPSWSISFWTEDAVAAKNIAYNTVTPVATPVKPGPKANADRPLF
jgi:hypothetical protein